MANFNSAVLKVFVSDQPMGEFKIPCFVKNIQKEDFLSFSDGIANASGVKQYSIFGKLTSKYLLEFEKFIVSEQQNSLHVFYGDESTKVIYAYENMIKCPMLFFDDEYDDTNNLHINYTDIVDSSQEIENLKNNISARSWRILSERSKHYDDNIFLFTRIQELYNKHGIYIW
jgi:hypothetical protein